MSQGTSLVAFKQAIITNLTARSGLSGVQVAYAWDDLPSGDDHLEGEAIWLGDTTWPEYEIPVMRSGTKKVDERYELELFIQVLKVDGSDQETADVRAQALLVEVQQALAETPQQSAQIFVAQFVVQKHHTGQIPPGPGHGSRFDCVLAVHARLA